MDSVTQPEADTQKPKKDSEQPSRAAQLGTTLSMLVIGGLLVSMLGVPIKVAAGILAVAAVVVAIRFFAASSRENRPASWFIMGVISIIVSGYVGLGTIGTILTYQEQADYQECVSSALTEQASASCTSEYNTALNDKFKKLTGIDMPGLAPQN